MMKFLDELKKLNLPKNLYVIFGSGPLAIRNIRTNHDIDVLVTKSLWDLLAFEYEITSKPERPDSIYIGNLQFLQYDYKDWSPAINDPMLLLSDYEEINGYPFVKLEYLLECKKQMIGKKHHEDVKIIEAMLVEGRK